MVDSESESHDRDVLAHKLGYYGLLLQLKTMHNETDRCIYLMDRWFAALASASKGVKRDRRNFRVINLFTLGAASVTPVLVTATAGTTDTFHSVLTWAAIFFSLVAAIGGVLLQTLRSGSRWRLHRTKRDELEAAGWELLTAARKQPADNSTDDGSWNAFVRRAEVAIDAYNAVYREEISGVLGSSGSAPPTSAPPNDGAKTNS